MKSFGFIAAALIVLASSASASTEGKSELTDKVGASSIVESLYLNYFGVFHGPSLNTFNAYTVDRNGKTSKQGMFMDGELTAAYLLDKNIGVGAVLPFLASPVLGADLTLGDAGVKFFNRKTLSAPGLNVYTNVIVQAPTSDYSQDRGMQLGLKTTPNVRYSIPSSRFTVGSWTEAKAYLGVTKGKAFKLWAGPYVNYQLVPNLSLNVEYEMEWDHNIGDTGLLNFTTYQTDLQPGFVWNITPHILLNPYVQIFTTKTATAETMALGAVFSATLL